VVELILETERIASAGEGKMSLGPLLFLTMIFFFNFIARVALAPLMPSIEKDLKIGHDEAGSLFFLLSLGYCIMLLFSGFVSARLNHRRTIVLSSLAVGASLFIVALSPHLWGIRIGLVLTGMAAGLYLPSGIATVTELASSRDWGKAIAIHELAPNLGFVAAPFIAEAFLKWASWRGVFEFLAIAALVAGLLFLRFGKGGRSYGQAPDLHVFKTLLKDSTFWIVAAFFALGIGAQFGVYAMLPLFLVSERGMDGSWANTLLGLSRLMAIAMTFFSGWMTDRFGAKQALKGVFLSTGLATVMLSFVPPPWLILFIFLQPMFATTFFPAGFAALSKMGSASTKNVAVSLTVPIGFLVGGGAIPAGIGLIGEAGSFSTGLLLFGGLLLVGSLSAQALKLAESSPN
jgi:NNP family nitrate/nitrite transporter-like MFS transporter